MDSEQRHLHPTRRSLLGQGLALAGLGAWAGAASGGEGWPSRPVRLLVGFPAGTSPDLIARILAEPLSQRLGQPVVVENHPGASGTIAADQVAKSTDGHTLGVMINGNLTIARLLNPRTPYDPLRDLAPVSLVASAPLVLAAPLDPTVESTAQWLALARTRGNRWSYGSPGVGTVGHLAMELLKARAGLQAVHVPYPGYPQIVNAMLMGDIQVSMLPPGLAQAQAQAGKIRLLGVSSSIRSTLVPGVPSLAEAGVRDFELEIWNAVAGPRSMSPALASRLSGLLSEIVRGDAVRQRLFQQGWQVVGASAEALRRRMDSDTGMLGRIIADQGIKAD